MSSISVQHPLYDDFFAKLGADRNNRPSTTSAETSRVSTVAKYIMMTCSLVALVTSSYLAWASMTSSAVAGCGGGSVFDCSHVLHTRWSTVLSIPVSIPAIVIHVTVLGLLLMRPASTAHRRTQMASLGFASLAAGAAAIWFIYLQIFVIRHLCPYCLVAHTAGIILASIFLWEQPVGPRSLKWIGLSVIASVALLATLQLTADGQQSYETIHHTTTPELDGTTSNSNNFSNEEADLFAPPVSAQLHTSLKNIIKQINPQTLLCLGTGMANPASLFLAEVQADSGTSTKAVEILGGLKLATDAWPLIGEPDAELVFVQMFDYTCPHCRKTHESLKAAETKYGDRLAVISLPVPLDGKCNPTVRSTAASHGEACEIAKLAIAVWATDHQQFTEFHNFLFESQPNYAQAMVKAESMLDKTMLGSVLSSSLPGDYVQKHITLYQKAGAGQIPKLLFPKTTTVGAIESKEAMIRLIEQHATR